MIRDATWKESFVLDHKFTSALEVGAEIKIVGFASGNDFGTVHDSEVIKVVDSPMPSLIAEKQYYVLASEDL